MEIFKEITVKKLVLKMDYTNQGTKKQLTGLWDTIESFSERKLIKEVHFNNEPDFYYYPSDLCDGKLNLKGFNNVVSDFSDEKYLNYLENQQLTPPCKYPRVNLDIVESPNFSGFICDFPAIKRVSEKVFQAFLEKKLRLSEDVLPFTEIIYVEFWLPVSIDKRIISENFNSKYKNSSFIVKTEHDMHDPVAWLKVGFKGDFAKVFTESLLNGDRESLNKFIILSFSEVLDEIKQGYNFFGSFNKEKAVQEIFQKMENLKSLYCPKDVHPFRLKRLKYLYFFHKHDSQNNKNN